jgi:L-methionine (R)-S-oxide reductase
VSALVGQTEVPGLVKAVVLRLLSLCEDAESPTAERDSGFGPVYSWSREARRRAVDERRAGRYERIYKQLRELIEGRSPGLTAAMATICAVLHAKMPHHSWTGFYFATGDRLHVGPYQGPVACQVLEGRGVCLEGVRTKRPVVVPDVDTFPGHIACDARSRSEIVLPVVKGGAVVAVLDVDSDKLDQFSEADVEPLERILSLLQPYL